MENNRVMKQTKDTLIDNKALKTDNKQLKVANAMHVEVERGLRDLIPKNQQLKKDKVELQKKL